MLPLRRRLGEIGGAIAAALALFGCDDAELPPPRAPHEVLEPAPCVDEVPPPPPPRPASFELAAFTPAAHAPTVVIPLDGLMFLSDTPQGYWLRGVQPPSHAPWWLSGRYHYDRDPRYAPFGHGGRRRRWR